MSRESKQLATVEIGNVTAGSSISSQVSNRVQLAAKSHVTGEIHALETRFSDPSTLKSNERIREVASRFIDFAKQN
ncbi:hypothetical protein DUZ99_17455 [Xylanibacillus composti]|uniref:Uncharacterized protein n=1 Tax=Xylanibacillus composti TaxID=1572762 RepID=A0A8J4H5R2_9BACL|nr:hypothetical protein [Xylanibacillus composti]MDT9726767.1 hypothetical protein [Xylanibacillus composti]GIQ71473.1 hypothetical protein XYCOK13_42970 [Xylanibacillus composti]